MNNQACHILELENFLIERYVRESLTTTDSELANYNLTKARALNAPYMLYLQGHHHIVAQNHAAGLDCFLAAYELGLKDPAFLGEMEDSLLRHGTFEQYTGFLANIVQQDPSNGCANFILATVDFYRATVAGLHAKLKRNFGSAKPKIILNATFWGSKYANIFLNYSLAALMSAKNIPLLSEQYEIHLVLATTRDDFDLLPDNPLFNRLLCYAHLHFIELPETLLNFAQNFTKQQGGGWTIPATMLTNSQQYAVIECARLLGIDLLMIYPDHILTNSFLSDLLPPGHGQSAISGLCFRFHYDLSLLGKIDSHKNSQGILDIDAQMLCKWLLEYLPEENFTDSKNFSTFPIYLCWKVADEGVIAHVNHYCLWFIRGADLTGPVYPSLDPIDGFFLQRHLRDHRKVGLAPEKVIGFDLGNNPLVAPLDGTPFQVAKVADWLRPWLTEVHQNYFEKPMKYSATGNYQSAQWDDASEAARCAVQEIIALAKRPRQVFHD